MGLCMGHTSIPHVRLWAAGLPPCWLLRRPKGAGEPGLGAREWVEKSERNWEEWDPMADAGAVEDDDAPLVIQFTQYLPREAGAPRLPGSPQGSTQPRRQMLAAGRNPGLEALSSGGSLPPRRGGAGMRGTPETCSESQQGQC